MRNMAQMMLALAHVPHVMNATRNRERISLSLKNVSRGSRVAVVCGLSLAMVLGSLAMPQPAQAKTLSQAKAELSQISDEYDALQKELDEKSDQLELTKGEIEKTQGEIDEKQKELDTARRQLASSMANDYRSGEYTILDAIADSDSIEDMIENSYYYNRASDVKTAQIADVEKTQDELAKKQSDLQAKQDEQKKTLDETQEQVEAAERKQEEAQALVNSLEAEAAAEARAAMSESLREATSSSGKSKKSSSSINTSVGNSSIIEYAKRFIGVPYVYGGSTPSGFDCSGFVNYVYNAFGIPTGGRTTYSIASYLQSSGKAKYSLSELVPGDMILTHAGHVGLYIGSGMMIHSPRPGRSVCIQSVYSFYLGGGL